MNHRKDREYYKILDKVVDEVFQKAAMLDLTDADLARVTGLSYPTILNLDNRVTRYPQLRTVIMLAKGMNMVLSLDFRNKVKEYA